MELHRVRSISLSQAESRYRGSCTPCGQAIEYRQKLVHLCGDTSSQDRRVSNG
jgi:hypothetical protein